MKLSVSICIVKFLIVGLSLTAFAQCPNYSVSVTRLTQCGPTQFILTVVDENQNVVFADYQWYEGGNPIPGATSYSYTTPVLSTYKMYSVEVSDFFCGLFVWLDAFVTPNPIPAPPQVETSVVCGGPGSAVIKVTHNAANASSYNWYDDTGEYIDPLLRPGIWISGVANSELHIDYVSEDAIYFVRAVKGPCQSGSAIAQVFIDTDVPSAPIGTNGSTCGAGTVTLSAAPGGGSTISEFKWYTSQTSQTVWKTGSTVTSNPLSAGQSATYWVEAVKSTGCVSARTSVTAISNIIPPAPATSSIQLCDFESLYLSYPTGNYNWYSPTGEYLSTGMYYKAESVKEGTYVYKSEALSSGGCTSLTRADFTVTVAKSCDEKLNRIYTVAFDEHGEKVGETKTYFDYTGQSIQVQSMNLERNQVMVSQSLKDARGRSVISGLIAPLDKSNFEYKHRFITDMDGDLYNSDDFDGEIKYSAEPVGNTERGTLGWYYSNNNDLEDHVPITSYPYQRSEYYEDGTGRTKRVAAAGEHHRLGSGHEILSGTFPVFNELDDYVNNRRTDVEFINNSFEGGGVSPWQNFYPYANAQGFQWSYEGVIQADAISSGFSETSYIGQSRGNGLKWPSGEYQIKIIASNTSTGGLSPLTSGLVLAGSNNPSSNVSSISYSGDGTLPVGTYGKELIVTFTLNQEYDYLLLSFTKYGPSSGYRVKISISEIDILTYNGLPQNGEPLITLEGRGLQSIVRDENGKYAISISDKNGNTVMSARKGSPGTFGSDFTLSVQNSIVASAYQWSENYRPLIYFYLLEEQPVTLSGGTDFIVEDLLTGEAKGIGETFANGEGKWPAGFYRITLQTGEIYLSYTNYYLDVSYHFYDDAGRLKSSISPNGFKAWKQGTPHSDIDKTTYTYNHRGWLLSMTQPDAGLSVFKYRKDGKIRFSQNALQRENTIANQNGKGKFSYTNYDLLGRPIESGEYTGTSVIYGASLDSQLEFFSQQNFTEKKDWVRTYYDEPAADFAAVTGLSTTNYVQEFVRGKVSWTENKNIRTYYSYDDLGRVKWVAQKPTGLPRTFVVKYNYDFLGNVLEVANLSYSQGQVVEQFYHHYEYSRDKKLINTFTSIDGSSKKLRAHYEYYLHGPLKRVELGDKIQGIDFIYNIHGWLTQINHPDVAQDPGQDGANGFREDAFGMVLDYYESALGDLFEVSLSPTPIDPENYHQLPSLGNGIEYAVAALDRKGRAEFGITSFRQALKEQYSTH